jgi:ubiquinone/menaquinone biosynthesis C-methylase UbiE
MSKETGRPDRQESYVHSYDGAATKQVFSGRTAEKHAAFFLPYLEPGMRLLDCGSGPGSITSGLARVVSPGEVTGIEIEAGQVALAKANAAKLELANLRFEQGSAYALPYADHQFDAVFSHAMLEHLTDPVAAAR